MICLDYITCLVRSGALAPLIVAAFFTATSAAAPKVVDRQHLDLTLTVGRSTVIDCPSDVQQISTSSPEIVDAAGALRGGRPKSRDIVRRQPIFYRRGEHARPYRHGAVRQRRTIRSERRHWRKRHGDDLKIYALRRAGHFCLPSRSESRSGD